MSGPLLTPGEHGGGKPAEPKPKEPTPTNSPFLDFGNPPPSPSPPTSSTPPPPSPPSDSNPVFNKHRAEEHVERTRKTRDSVRDKRSRRGNLVILAVLPEAFLLDDIDLSVFVPLDPGETREGADDWYGSSPLTPGQEVHVRHLLSVETDTLARDVLIGLQREGMPSKAYTADFMAQFAEWTWDDLSDAVAMHTLEAVRDSDWDELLEHSDSKFVETVAQDLGNNTREGLVIIDAGSETVLLRKTGVVGKDGSQFVGVQDYEVEDLKGLELIFVHNHTLETEASDEDLDSAFDAGAKLLIVITPQGREYVYIRGRYGMVKVRDEKANYKVGPPTLDETIALARCLVPQ